VLASEIKEAIFHLGCLQKKREAGREVQNEPGQCAFSKAAELLLNLNRPVPANEIKTRTAFFSLGVFAK